MDRKRLELTPRHYFATALAVAGAVFTAAALALNLPAAAVAIVVGQTALVAVTLLIGPRSTAA